MGGGSQPQQVTSQSYNSTTLPPSYAQQTAAEGAGLARQLQSNPYVPAPYGVLRYPLDKSRTEVQNLMTGEYGNIGDIATITPDGNYVFPYQSMMAPLNQQQETSVGNISNWANQPSNVLDTATNQLVDTMGGSYLNPESNPYLSQYVQQAQGDVTRNYQNTVQPQLAAAATRAGAFGGSGDTLMRTEAMNNLGSTLSKTATDIYAPAYESERNRQLQSQLFAPQLDQSYLPHYQAGLAAGDIERQAQQDYLNEIVANAQKMQQWPYQTAAASGAVYSPYVAGTGTTSGYSTGTQTGSGAQGASPFSQIMGSALGAGGLLSSIFL
jgi:hypothetical protein